MKNITFIDTCIISDALENKNIMMNLIKFIIDNQCFCGITEKTLSELHKSKSMFDEFHKYLNILPFFLIKPSKILISDEINRINTGEPINISLINLKYTKEELYKLTNDIVRIVDNEFYKGAKSEVTNSIQDLKKNYPPKNGKNYLNQEINRFCELIITQQLDNHHFGLLSKLEKKVYNQHDFGSLKSQALITFWKFYKRPERKPRNSDAFDISMSSCFPYMDIILTEKNMASDILQIKKEGFCFQDLKQVLTISAFK